MGVDQLTRLLGLAVKNGPPLDAQLTLTNLSAGAHRVAAGDGPGHAITIPSRKTAGDLAPVPGNTSPPR
jgi:hypothetical protein